MKVKQREIILIPFPFSDLTKTKVRPALVISNDSYNQSNLGRLGKLEPSDWQKIKEKLAKLWSFN